MDTTPQARCGRRRGYHQFALAYRHHSPTVSRVRAGRRRNTMSTRWLARGTLAALICTLYVPAAPAAAILASPVLTADGASADGTGPASAYWTRARMRTAIRNSSRAEWSALASVSRASVPRPAPAHLRGMKAIGRVFGVNPGGQLWSCTGTLLDSPNGSVVWTAGHCIHTGRGGAFNTNVAFAPGYQPLATGNPTPYGIWPAARVAVPGAWARKGVSVSGDPRVWTTAQYDAGALVLSRDATGRRATDAVGAAQHIRFGVRKSRFVRVMGYPLAAPYFGETLMECGPSRTHKRRFAVRLRMIRCTLGQGMSGGPALMRVDAAGVGTVIGGMSLTDFRHIYIFPQGSAARRLYRFVAALLS
jgi:V8-like Glu-specific endopeptidase